MVACLSRRGRSGRTSWTGSILAAELRHNYVLPGAEVLAECVTWKHTDCGPILMTEETAKDVLRPSIRSQARPLYVYYDIDAATMLLATAMRIWAICIAAMCHDDAYGRVLQSCSISAGSSELDRLSI